MFDDKPLRVYAATKALLAIAGISGNYTVSSEVPERERVVAAVATIFGIVGDAIALSTNAVMVTRNQKDFSKIPDLVLEDWTPLLPNLGESVGG